MCVLRLLLCRKSYMLILDMTRPKILKVRMLMGRTILRLVTPHDLAFRDAARVLLFRMLLSCYVERILVGFRPAS